MDLRGLDGPQVDIDCYAQETEVDLWEAGLAIPTWDQLTALAELTDFPVGFFYRPAPKPAGPIYICGPKDIDLTHNLSSTTAAPLGTGMPTHQPRRRPNPAAADAAARGVLAAREKRRRARESGDLIPAPPGWRTRP